MAQHAQLMEMVFSLLPPDDAHSNIVPSGDKGNRNSSTKDHEMNNGKEKEDKGGNAISDDDQEDLCAHAHQQEDFQ
jgi:hypothetical protein